MSSKANRRPKDSSRTENVQEHTNLAALPLAQALSDHLNGNIESALSRLNSSDEDSNVADVVAARGHLLLRANRFDEAHRQFARLISLEPALEPAHFHSGFCLYQLGRFEGALAAFEESHRLAPDRADTQIARGNCLLNVNRPAEAAAVFDECLAKHPHDESALLGKAVALQMAGDANGATNVCEELLTGKSVSVECLANVTVLGLQNSNFELVRASAGRLLQVDPNSEVALQGLGAAALAAEEFGAAAQHYQRLVELQPANYDYWLNLGVARHRLGNHDGAAESYKKASQIRPEGSSAYMNLGLLHQERGEAAQAAMALEQALKIAPERDDVRYDAAIALDESGESDKAAALYEALLQKNDGMTGAWFRLGLIRLNAEEFSQAARCFEKCIQLRPDWIEAEINLALAYGKQGQKHDVDRILQKALTHKPDSIELTRMLAAVSLDHNQFESALRFHLHLMDLGDQSAEVRHNLGLLYQNRGDLTKAEAEYKDAITVNPDFPEAHLNLGNVLDAAGQKEAAREHWIRALQLKPELALGYYLS